MRAYKLKVKMVFEATVIVRAHNRYDAKTIAERDWGCTLNNASTSNLSDSKTKEGVVDWNVTIHPVKTIIK